jgi:MFS transporter, OFA family, oxalate/formate antiporter
MFKIKITNRWIVVIGAVLIQLALGTIYSWGVLTPYFTSYLRQFNDTLVYSDTQYIFAVGLFAFAVTMIFSGKLQQKYGPMIIGLVGAVLMSLGVILTLFMRSFIGVFFTYGILFGVGIGFAYVTPIACAAKWFPDKKGLINGIAVAGFGAGAFIFNLIIKAFINPNKVQADLVVADKSYFTDAFVLGRVPYVFLLLGLIYLVMTVGGSLLLQNPPEGWLPEGYTPPVVKSEDGTVISTDFTREESIKTPQFWMLWAMFILTAAAGLFTIGNYKVFGEQPENLASLADKDGFLTLMGSIAALFNGLGRIAWGYLADKIGYKKTMYTMFGSQAVLMIILPFVGGSAALFFIVVNLIYFCFGGNFSLYPTATADTFGVKNLGPNYGIVFTAYGIAGISGALLASVLRLNIGFLGVFIIMGVFSLGAIAIAYFVKPPKR